MFCMSDMTDLLCHPISYKIEIIYITTFCAITLYKRIKNNRNYKKLALKIFKHEKRESLVMNLKLQDATKFKYTLLW